MGEPTSGHQSSNTHTRTSFSQGEAPAFALPERIADFRILQRIGAGGMGVVYEAEQDTPQRRVALKVLPLEQFSREREQRFKLESEVLGRLQHPAIAQVYRAGTYDQGYGPQPYFAMELIRGVSLTKYATAQKLDVDQKLALLQRICEGVHHAHQRGVIHRDLKPDNILIDESGQPKILDFGLARATNADLALVTMTTHVGAVLGTLHYMSPEQATGNVNELDTRCDIYALGVITFELLTHGRPYTLPQDAIVEAIRMIVEEPPARLSSVDKSLQGDIELIVATTLEKDKERRYASVVEFSADLGRYRRQEPISARPPSKLYRFQKFASRNKLLVVSICGITATLLVGIGTSSIGFARAQSSARTAVAESAKAKKESERAEEAERNALAQLRHAVASERLAREREERANNMTAQLFTERARQELDRGRVADALLLLTNSLLAREDLWDTRYLLQSARRRAENCRFLPSRGRIMEAQFLGAHGRLLTLTDEDVLTLWHLDSHTPVFESKVDESSRFEDVFEILLPDSETARLLVKTTAGFVLVDIASGEVLSEIELTHPELALPYAEQAVNPNSHERFAVYSGGQVAVFDTRSGRQVSRIASDEKTPQPIIWYFPKIDSPRRPPAVVWVTGGTHPMLLYRAVQNTAQGFHSHLYPIGRSDAQTYLDISPDGSKVLLGPYEDGRARVWDIATGAMAFAGPQTKGYSVGGIFSSDGSTILTASRMISRSVTRRIVDPNPDNSRWFGTTNYSFLELWDARTGEQLLYVECPMQNGQPAGEGNTTQNEPLSLVVTPQMSPNGRWVAAMTRQPDESISAITEGPYELTVWDAANTNIALRIEASSVPVYEYSFTSHGNGVFVRTSQPDGNISSLFQWSLYILHHPSTAFYRFVHPEVLAWNDRYYVLGLNADGFLELYDLEAQSVAAGLPALKVAKGDRMHVMGGPFVAIESNTGIRCWRFDTASGSFILHTSFNKPSGDARSWFSEDCTRMLIAKGNGESGVLGINSTPALNLERRLKLALEPPTFIESMRFAANGSLIVGGYALNRVPQGAFTVVTLSTATVWQVDLKDWPESVKASPSTFVGHSFQAPKHFFAAFSPSYSAFIVMGGGGTSYSYFQDLEVYGTYTPTSASAQRLIDESALSAPSHLQVYDVQLSRNADHYLALTRVAPVRKNDSASATPRDEQNVLEVTTIASGHGSPVILESFRPIPQKWPSDILNSPIAPEHFDAACTVLLGRLGNNAAIWDTKTGRIITELMLNRTGELEHGWLTADGELACAYVYDGRSGESELQVWNAHDGGEYFRVSGSALQVRNVDDVTVVRDGDKCLVVDIQGCITLVALQGYLPEDAEIIIDSHRRFLLVKDPRQITRVFLYSITSGRLLDTFEVSYDIEHFDLHPSGTLFVTSGTAELDVWNLGALDSTYENASDWTASVVPQTGAHPIFRTTAYTQHVVMTNRVAETTQGPPPSDGSLVRPSTPVGLAPR